MKGTHMYPADLFDGSHSELIGVLLFALIVFVVVLIIYYIRRA